MESLQSFVKQLIENPDKELTLEQVDSVLERYPFFTLPAVVLLRQNPRWLSDDDKRRLIGRVAINMPDRTLIADILDPDNSRGYAPFYPVAPEPERVTTDDAIDTFLDTYCTIDPAEEALLTRMIFNPVPDYASVLAEEEKQSLPDDSETADGSQDALLNAFILKSKRDEGLSATTDVDEPVAAVGDAQEAEQSKSDSIPPEDALLSESLAKIFIKQHRYERAYEIISRLNLNYPEKSVYFADQLRFLRKLIINSQYTKQKTK